LSYELQDLPSISQVSWETIFGLSTLLLVRFGTLGNPIRDTILSFDKWYNMRQEYLENLMLHERSIGKWAKVVVFQITSWCMLCQP